MWYAYFLLIPQKRSEIRKSNKGNSTCFLMSFFSSPRINRVELHEMQGENVPITFMDNVFDFMAPLVLRTVDGPRTCSHYTIQVVPPSRRRLGCPAATRARPLLHLWRWSSMQLVSRRKDPRGRRSKIPNAWERAHRSPRHGTDRDDFRPDPLHGLC